MAAEGRKEVIRHELGVHVCRCLSLDWPLLREWSAVEGAYHSNEHHRDSVGLVSGSSVEGGV